MGETLSKKIIHKVLKKIKQGTIRLNDGDESHIFQDANGVDRACATIDIIHPRAYKRILLQGSLGAGKSYIQGDWYSDDLQKLIEVFIKNDSLFYTIESPIARFLSWIRAISYKLNFNTIQRAKDNILSHYNLGNDFFKVFPLV